MDTRILWIKTIISNTLGIHDEEYIDELVANNLQKMEAFFEEELTAFKDFDKAVIFYWRTFYDKLIEEEETVIEECKSL